jgi:hypothetical protein
MSQLIRFPEEEAIPTLEELVKETHELAKCSEKVYFCAHAREGMSKRYISIQQVFDVLRQGKGVDDPCKDPSGCWRIKLERYSAGAKVQVVVAVYKKYLTVVTVINKSGKNE